MSTTKSGWYELFQYFEEKDCTKKQGPRLFTQFLKRNSAVISNMDSLELDGEPTMEAIQPMGTFVDTVMLACWHWLNPKNGKEDDLFQLCISASQIELRKDFDITFGRGHGVTVKPKGSSSSLISMESLSLMTKVAW